MRSSRRPSLRLVVLAVAASLVAAATSASAQLCGDADGSGSVSVNDAVQALRAAAGLSNTCAGGACDVDGNGSVSVSDGVNVLRAAAGLSFPNACRLVNQEVAAVVGIVQSFMQVGVAAIPRPQGAQAIRGRGRSNDLFACENQGGTLETFSDGAIFRQCQIDIFVYNGAVVVLSASTIEFDLFVDNLVTGESDEVSGQLGFFANGDGSVTVSGAIGVSSSFFGAFTVGLSQVTVTSDGFILGGTIAIQAQGGTTTDLTSIQVGFDGTRTAFVIAGFGDGHNESFFLDIVTGELTPAG